MVAFRPRVPRGLPRICLRLAVSVTMAMRFDADVAAAMLELQQRACGRVCLLMNAVMANADPREGLFLPRAITPFVVWDKVSIPCQSVHSTATMLAQLVLCQ